MEKQLKALKVIATDTNIREYLAKNDPMALGQVEEAIAVGDAKEAKMIRFGEFTVHTSMRHIQQALDHLTDIEFRMWMDACNGDLTPNISYSHYEGAEQCYLATGEWQRM